MIFFEKVGAMKQVKYQSVLTKPPSNLISASKKVKLLEGVEINKEAEISLRLD